VVDPQNANLPRRAVALVHDAVGTSPRGPQTIELATQPMANRLRLVRQGADQELDNRGRRLLGQACQSALG
jgi:hypothetical protein